MTRDLNDLKPTTVEGIQSLARQLKKRDGITHTEALDMAAKQGGFKRWAHAVRVLIKEKRP